MHCRDVGCNLCIETVWVDLPAIMNVDFSLHETAQKDQAIDRSHGNLPRCTLSAMRYVHGAPRVTPRAFCHIPLVPTY